MSKIAVIYWSGTGNTQAMAHAIVEGIKSVEGVAELYEVTNIDALTAAGYDSLALGCPSMGGEVLEEIDFDPFFTALEGQLSGKKVALFGSYGWGDGEWMRDWQGRVERSGANLFEEGLIVNDTPDASALSDCRSFGERFTRF